MCQNITFLKFIFMIKIIIFIILPILILILNYLKRNNKKIFIIEICLLSLFIILNLFNNSCIKNSNISFFKSNKITLYSEIGSYDPNVVDEVVTNKIYKTANNRNVYYFNNSELPISNKKYYCDDKEIFLKNYGNGITAISMLISSALDKNIDPINVYNYAVENDLFDCENGVDAYELLNSIAIENNLHVIEVSEFNLLNYINSGGIVLAKVEFNPYVDNFACDNSNVIIYNINNENNYKILNPNNKDYDYICPDNSLGYGSIIKANTNDMSWTSSNLTTIYNAYYAIERN